MWIKSFRVVNYKSIDDSGEHTLARHMNVIVGQNNAGKTALLQAIAQRLETRPHKNSSQRRGAPTNPSSGIHLNFTATEQELHDIIMSSGNVGVPIPEAYRSNPLSFLKVPHMVFSALYRAAEGQGTGWIQHQYPSNNIETPGAIAMFTPDPGRSSLGIGQLTNTSTNDNIGIIVGAALTRKTYLFNALRSPAPRSSAGSNSVLLPDAQNLPEVLSTFQPNRTLYKAYIDQVRRVLPLVKWVDVTPIGNHSEVRVWNVDEESTRDDLPNPLSECGTGVGQVLAILYVVIRSTGDVICIDEPNSFLHPGAAKALMTILNEHKEHQYVIATHSPEIIVTSHPERLFMLSFASERTVIKELNQSDVDSARQMLEEIGSSPDNSSDLRILRRL
jgi:predicted ATPase